MNHKLQYVIHETNFLNLTTSKAPILSPILKQLSHLNIGPTQSDILKVNNIFFSKSKNVCTQLNILLNIILSKSRDTSYYEVNCSVTKCSEVIFQSKELKKLYIRITDIN